VEANTKRLIAYWLAAWAFSILFGEIILPALVGHALPIFTYTVAFLIYYGILSLVFAFFVVEFGTRSLIVFFVYGVVVEMFLFGNIKGPKDVPGILFFGLLYVFLFWTPMWLVNLLKIAGVKQS